MVRVREASSAVSRHSQTIGFKTRSDSCGPRKHTRTTRLQAHRSESGKSSNTFLISQSSTLAMPLGMCMAGSSNLNYILESTTSGICLSGSSERLPPTFQWIFGVLESTRDLKRLLLCRRFRGEITWQWIDWKVDFKSAWAAKQFMDLLESSDDDEVWRFISFYQRRPQTKTIAGHMFKPLAHRMLANTATQSLVP